MFQRIFCAALLLAALTGSARASAPSLPGFTKTPTSHVFTAAVTIPDNGTLTRTLTVSGANPYLWDVDLVLLIDHALTGGTLDITLTSPQGTTVVVSTNNPFLFFDYFNIEWDDQGLTPITETGGNSLPLARQLEGAMGAFIGENPNGIWTLSITDDNADASAGYLSVANLLLTTLDSTPPEKTYTATKTGPELIPDNPAPALNSTLAVSGMGKAILRMTLTTNIAHTANGDLDIQLTSPAGTVVIISTDNGGTLDNVFNGTTWRDKLPGFPVTDAVLANNVTAQFLVPEGAMAAFNGEDPNGTWTLQIRDDTAGNTGTLTSWSLSITTLPLAPSLTSGLSALPSPAVAGQAVQFNFGVSDDDNLTYMWNFGDSMTMSTSTGSVSHTYAAAGNYNVSVTATDASNLTASGALTLQVATTGTGGGNATNDTDGDGFSDAIENAAGTLANDANSFPQIGGSNGTGGTVLLPDVKLSVKLNFAKPASDSISLSGTVIVPSGFTAAGAAVLTNIGGISNTFTLDAKGGSKTSTSSLKIGVKGAASTAKFSLKLSKSDLAAQLADEGYTGDTDVKGKQVQVSVTVAFGGATYQKLQTQLFSAKAGKTGSAKDKK